ncbi:MAG TPA: lysophospholipid acyltransferase family protein [Jatrophihabitantaceae bacterium]|jgi:1-acyl-sn-glycerol-3-phosphate acyltransferase|nr:lysophospholipid acyltransferase family protein [Jatrophihabitantaceae bacterium]
MSVRLAERVDGSRRLRGARRCAWLVCHALARLEVDGLEHVAATGGVVLVANHRSLMDGVVLFGALDRVVSCLVKAEAFRGPLAPVLRGCAQIPVHRKRVDPAPVRLGVELLRAGGVLGVFPEGTRGDGRVSHAKPGAGYFALRSGAVVVPVALHGTRQMVRRRSLRRPVVRMTAAAPMRFERWPDDAVLARRTVAEAAEDIRLRLAALVAEMTQDVR